MPFLHFDQPMQITFIRSVVKYVNQRRVAWNASYPHPRVEGFYAFIVRPCGFFNENGFHLSPSKRGIQVKRRKRLGVKSSLAFSMFRANATIASKF